MKFYTWCNDKKSERLNRILNSAKRQDITIEPIGEGRDIHEGGNYNGKNLWLYDKVCELPENEIVVCTDGFDVLYLSDETEIEKKFKKLDTPILYSAEWICSHHSRKTCRQSRKIARNKVFQFLNAGTMMGYAKEIKECLERIFSYDCKIDDFDDQKMLGQYYIENRGKMKLDHDCQIFWVDAYFEYDKVDYTEEKFKSSVHKIKHMYKNGRLFNQTTNTYPCIMHIPGWYGDCLLDEIEKFELKN
tara:strand:- start:7644 stop:8381 length:738 start_codon:yes stop_codon:yes gene_type:complete